MKWEHLSSDELKKIAHKGEVCVLPMGCLERHGAHLPLGTDAIISSEIAFGATKIEEAVVFPVQYITQIQEAKHCAGTIGIDGNLAIMVLESICDEIARNGFKKIILANAHGGNGSMIGLFLMNLLGKRKSYTVYANNVWLMSEEQNKILDDKYGAMADGGHAGRYETSVMMVLRPELVKTELLDSENGASLERLPWIYERGVQTSISWYADYPNQLAGFPQNASVEYGRDALEMNYKNFSDIIKMVKQDKVSPKLLEEFYKKSNL